MANEIAIGVMLDGVGNVVSQLNALSSKINATTKQMSSRMNSNMSSIENSFENTTRHASDLAQEVQDIFGPMAIGKTRAFKMELLGVMFFGMQIQKTFMGMLQPAMEAFGVFDIWKDMMLIMFIPIMDVLFPMFLKFTDFFMSLPEPVMQGIGVLVALAAALGGLLFYVGVVGLGLSSIVQWFGPLIGAVSGSASTMVILKGILIAIGPTILLIAGIVAALWLAWKYNFGNIREYTNTVFDGIKNIFSGFVNIFKGLWSVLQGVIELDGKKIWDGIKIIAEGFSKIFIEGVGGIAKGISKFLWDSLGDIAAWVLELNKKIYELLTRIPLIGGAIGAVGGAVGAIGERVLGSRQIGGYIPQTGLYRLHAGETVIPSTDVGGINITVNVNNSSGGMNERYLAEKIGEVVTAQLRNATIR